jgi:formylglycine-generating enzyme required for sulfatase activity
MRRLACALLVGIGCAPAIRSDPADPRPAPPDVDGRGCGEARDPLHPLIVGWPATSRAELETAAAAGPVVVSYAGCVLKVLSSCRAGVGGYESAGTTPAEDRLDVRSTRDLHADLPLGVAGLTGKLEEGTRLALDYVTVGERMLKQAPTVLQGDCEGATHYVGAMALGAFRLVSLRTANAAAGARVAGAAAEGAASSSEEIRGASGDLGTCRAQGFAAGPACRAVLGLALRPLGLRGGKPAAAGFGLGLARPEKVPEVAQLPFVASASEFARVDVALLELLQAAVAADRSDGMPSVAKAQAWDHLVRYAPSSRYAAMASRRRDEWLRRAPAEKARRAQVFELCPRYREDRRKLDRLLKLETDVLGDDTKHAYEKELADAYAPWPELGRCAELEAEAAAEAAWPALHGANDGMVRVAGGTFEMGSTLPDDHAAPVHTVTVGDFAIDVTEVTVEAYARCQRAGACSQRVSHSGDDTWRCNDDHQLTAYGPVGGESRDQAPANCMTFGQAEAYCRWAGKRLPTEEEWEYAARGTDGRRYPWGEWEKVDGRPVFPFTYCGQPGSSNGYRVGGLAKNTSPFGARDMAGSVWEWTTGRYSAGYDKPQTTHERVLRGGEFGWTNDPDCKPFGTAYRFKHEPGYGDSNIGARCARGGTPR